MQTEPNRYKGKDIRCIPVSDECVDFMLLREAAAWAGFCEGMRKISAK